MPQPGSEKKIEKSRYPLRCNHCGFGFDGSVPQFNHRKYKKGRNFCSPVCRLAWGAEYKKKTVPECGPCPTCGKKFYSRRTEKIYCGMECYMQSDQFRAMVKSNGRRSRPKKEKIARRCLECEMEFLVAPYLKKKLCSVVCSRSWYAARFDRWIASP